MADSAYITTNVSDGISISTGITSGATINTTVNEGTSISAQVVTGAKGDKGDTGLPGIPGSTDYNALTNKPALAAVATSGSYTDLTGKPTIPTVTGTNTGDETATTIKTKLGITTLSGANTGDQDLSSYATTASVTPKADKTYVDSQDTSVATTAATNLSAHTGRTDNPHSVTKAQVGLSNVPNTDFTAAVAANTAKNSYPSADATKLAAITGTNTGDETTSTIKTKLGITTLSGSNTGDQTTVSGNAGTATALQTPRNINGVAFDGTADITVADATKVPLAGGTMTGALTVTGATIAPVTNGVSMTSVGGAGFNLTDAVYLGTTYMQSYLATQDVLPQTNFGYNLGSSSNYWYSLYAQRLYLNSTAYLDGATAGIANLSGSLSVGGTTVISKGASTGSLYFGNGGQSDTAAAYSLSVGTGALLSITTGNFNLAIGSNALSSATTGSYNVAIGSTALLNNVTTGNNVGVGQAALEAMTSGGSSVAIGQGALASATSAGNNVAIGWAAGRYYSASNLANTSSTDSIFIGYGSRSSAVGQTNQIVIGKNVVGNGTNTVTIGNSSNTANYFTGSLTTTGVMKPQQAATASAPTYAKGAIYFDTTLNKLRIGGATAWETVTST